ncbi:MAG: HAD hydrolase family protein, partial [Porticoccaceae bacterium]
MHNPANQSALIFTDLDGSLLDHDSYSFEPAKNLLLELESAAIPVIPITSKTFAEVKNLRIKLGNQHPFIVENGA